MSFSLRLGAVSIASLLALPLAGCGSSSAAICSDVCDCMGCSDTEEEDCVDALDDAKKAAEDEGCEDQYDAYVSCFDDELECRDEVVSADGCDSEAEALAECANGSIGGIGVSPCDRAIDICEANGAEGNDDVECTGTTECAARCIVDANSCDFTDPDSPVSDCVSDCASGG